MRIDIFLLIRTVIESSMLAWGFSKVLKKRYPLILIQIIFSIIFCGSNFIGDTILSQIIQVPYVAKVPLALGGLIFVLHICFYGKLLKKIFVLFVIYLGMFMMDISLSLVMILGAGKSVNELSKWYAERPTVILFTFYGMLLIYLRYLPVIFSKEKETLAWKEKKGFILIPICQTLMLFGVVCCATITQDKRVFLILLLSTLLTCFCAFFLFESMRMVIRSVQIQEQSNYLIQKRQLQNEYDRMILEKTKELKLQQHDMANHLQTLKALLSQDINQAKEYVGDLGKKFEKAKIENFCENIIINSLLSYKSEQIKKKGIWFRTCLSIKANISFEAVDLISLFSNLIDNAIESAERIPEGFIEITDYEQGNLYTLKVTNSKKSEDKMQTRDGMFITSKEDINSHGYGTQIIQNIAQKYDGEVQFIDEGSVFTVVVLLQEK